jgi:hypothetical protein
MIKKLEILPDMANERQYLRIFDDVNVPAVYRDFKLLSRKEAVAIMRYYVDHEGFPPEVDIIDPYEGGLSEVMNLNDNNDVIKYLLS